MSAPVNTERVRGPKPRIDHARVKQLAALGHSDVEISADQNCDTRYVYLIRTGRVILKEERLARGLKSSSRFVHGSLHGKRAAGMPPFDHPAIMNGHTMFPSTVVRDLAGEQLLKKGDNSSKIGGIVLKGKWKGMPVFTLTLEERATCPKNCKHWRSCYGSQLHLARRISHESPDFERLLVNEVVDLGRRHPAGFVIRLHVLGEFFSVRYVRLWWALIETVPALRCFGYSARDSQDEIGQELRKLVAQHWERFAIRFSNAVDNVPATRSIEHPFQRPINTFICPSQTGATESCSTCAACWSTTRTVCFLQH